MSKKRVLAPSPHKISQETLDKLKTFEPVQFRQYKELVNTGQIRPVSKYVDKETGEHKTTKIKLTKPVQVYYDNENKNFLYLNPFYKTIRLCGEWANEEDV
ncbi:hypothetical protein [Flagellimonas nanhaiensis]|uniref:Uncharacterized protein n=1 Tax=Flagellimonas nanhaiensis TaxID=2292706 RepID=A0A371JNW3_9FLAO|nr:hypothetical protein [Allomuricauda nanhaiensis]RDY58908.1 hypothetical protein DX873_14715 [Allomuricauda nanhaiensis]